MPNDVLSRNNVTVAGNPAGQPMMFAHGFGCDQNMWRLVAPAFEERFRIVLFDYVGAGESDLSQYDPERYSELDGYAADVVEICEALDLTDVIFVGHSVSAMIGVLAAKAVPERFGALVLVGPSPASAAPIPRSRSGSPAPRSCPTTEATWRRSKCPLSSCNARTTSSLPTRKATTCMPTSRAAGW